MRVRFHPAADNPIRMAYVRGWKTTSDLIQRLDELETVVGGGRVVPAPWEPFYQECPCCRDALAYARARDRLQSPNHFAAAFAFPPGEDEQRTTPIDRANWLMLCAEGEPSNVTGKLMLTEALELWEIHESSWLEQVVAEVAEFGIESSVNSLHELVRQDLNALASASPVEDGIGSLSGVETGYRLSHRFDKELLQMDGWTQDPGSIYLPVDGKIHSLANEILLLNLQEIALLRGRRLVRTVTWDKVTLIYIFDGTVTFDISGERPLVVTGFKRPESVLRTIQECYRAATERMLQALATQVTRTTS